MLNVGFIGLGSMGGAMARSITRHLPSLHATHSSLLNVYDHSPDTLSKFAASNKSTPHPSPNLVFSNSSLVFICLPTTSIVKSVLVESQSSISQNSIIVDCTSGDPGESKELGQFVEKTLDAKYFDMPVSGGRAGALASTLTAMVGGNKKILETEVAQVASSFASNIVHVGEEHGAGCAVKSVNNSLNMLNLLSTAEGLVALKNFGVDPSDALKCINNSSGRSLQSTVRIPDEVLTNDFDYGFFLSLMRKDCGIGSKFINSYFPKNEGIIDRLNEVTLKCEAEVGMDGEVDYTVAVRHLEKLGGVELRKN